MANVLIACEESQAICKELRRLGHRAFSCDILECSGGHPEWHIKGDCLPIINGRCTFKTMDGVEHSIEGKWDMLIAHPPCTDLAVSGARHFEKKRNDGRQRAAIEFFCQFVEADCDKVAIENPVNIISGDYINKYFPDLAEKYCLPIKPTQIVSPNQFGDPVRKKTCWWTWGGIPKLIPTNVVEPKLRSYIKKDGRKTTFSEIYCIGEKSHDSRQRSKTYPGIAKAIAEQWVKTNECSCSM